MARAVELRSLATTPHEYTLKTMKQISDSDRKVGRKRNRRQEEEEEEEEYKEEEEKEEKKKTKTKKRRKLVSTAEAARQRYGEAAVDQSAQQQQTQIHDIVGQTEFQLKLQALNSRYPVYHSSLDQLQRGDCTQDVLAGVLTTPRPVVPLRLAELESKLLKEAGRWFDVEANKFVVFPECNRGDYCIASACHMNIEGLHRDPVILMASMSQQEYDQLLHDGEVADSAFSSMCVLCERFMVESVIHEHRSLVMNHKATPMQQPAHGLLDVVRPIQACANLKDEPGGYKGEYVREPRRDDLIVMPIANTCMSLLSAARDRRTGRMVVDQSALLYQPVVDAAAQPQVGVQVVDF